MIKAKIEYFDMNKQRTATLINVTDVWCLQGEMYVNAGGQMRHFDHLQHVELYEVEHESNTDR